MNQPLKSPIGLIAGNGDFPLAVAKNAVERGLEVIAVAHHGETSASLEDLVSSCNWIRVGQLGKIIAILKKAGVKQATFAGGIKRINFFGGARLDMKAISLISRLRSIRDDALLRGIAGELEKSGIAVFSASELLEESCPAAGLLTRRALSPAEKADALLGWDAAKGIGELDIGQLVVAYKGVIVAVETIEGTDMTLARAGEIARTAGKLNPGSGPVVVKLAKPQQDLRLDVPAIGPQTIEVMKAAGLTALVIEAEKCVLLRPQEVITAASAAGIAIQVCDSKAMLQSD